MSNRLPQQITATRNPTQDDAGVLPGSMWINVATTPRVAWICTDNTPGDAKWTTAGSIPIHTGYQNLVWEESGHDAGPLSVAGFSSAGAAAAFQSSADNQILQRVGGNIVFTSFAGTILFDDSGEAGYTAVYAPTGTTVTFADSSSINAIGNL